MDYKVIDYASWPRREMYEFFSAADQPFYNVAFRLDVTRAYNFAKEHSLSFYMVMTYLVTKAINSVEAFRYAKLDGQIVLFDSLMPSFTDLKPGAEQFHIVTMPCEGDITEFCREAKRRSLEQDCFIDIRRRKKRPFWHSVQERLLYRHEHGGEKPHFHHEPALARHYLALA